MSITKHATTITSSDTMVQGNDTYLVDASTGSMTLTLPPITIDGENYMVRRIDGTINNTLDMITSDGSLIDGLTDLYIPIYGNLTFVSWSGNWYTLTGRILRAIHANFFYTTNTAFSQLYVDTNNTTVERPIWYGVWPGGIFHSATVTISGSTNQGNTTHVFRIRQGTQISNNPDNTLTGNFSAANTTVRSLNSITIPPVYLPSDTVLQLTIQTTNTNSHLRIHSFYINQIQ